LEKKYGRSLFIRKNVMIIEQNCIHFVEVRSKNFGRNEVILKNEKT